MKAVIRTLLLMCLIVSGCSASANYSGAVYWPKENAGNIHLSRSAFHGHRSRKPMRTTSQTPENMGPWR